MDSDDDIQKPPLYDSDDEGRSPATDRPGTSDKEEKKRLEKERKEQEKREKEEEKRRKREEKLSRGDRGDDDGDEKNFFKKSFNQLSGFFASRQRAEVRPKEGVKCRVTLLDGSEYQTVVDKYAYGQHLFDKVCEQVNILEKEYFSLTYIGKRGIMFWLIQDRRIIKQMLEDPENPWVFDFRVKFYTPEPTILQEDITRYMLCLQLRNDIITGKLPCSFVTYALLGSYTAQSELGDYEPNPDGRDTDYLQDMIFAPNQTEDLLEKIVELHKTHFGQTPADAELNFLENAKKLQMYGMHFTSARDSELVMLLLGVYYGGIVVRDNVIINKFPWPKILKLSYNKRKKFYMKIRPAEFEQYENTIGFQMESHTHAKNFWRLALEHHTFFRLKRANEAERKNSNFLTQLGSRHRYSGRTQYQTRLQRLHRTQPEFERTSSRRTGRSLGGESSSFYDRHGEAWVNQGGSMARPYLTAEEGTGEKVSVLAGTGSNVNKVAYVKTVKQGPGEVAEEVQFEDRGQEVEPTGKGKKKKARPSTSVSSPTTPGVEGFDDTHESLPPYRNGESAEAAKKPKTKKKKGSTTTTTTSRTLDDGSTVTEYKTERTATIETRTQREMTVPYQSEDYDQALSNAIQSVTDVDHELNVKKIQLETDQLKKTKKKKKALEAARA